MIKIKDNIKVKIVKMEWLSEEANESVVTFEINDKAYCAFGFPVSFEVGKSYRVEFDLGYFSRDEQLIGEYIFFDIARLDIYEKDK